jgi:hypothetical protein
LYLIKAKEFSVGLQKERAQANRKFFKNKGKDPLDLSA